MQLAHILRTYIGKISKKIEMKRLVNSQKPVSVVTDATSSESLSSLVLIPRIHSDHSMSSQCLPQDTAPSGAGLDGSSPQEESTVLEIIQVLSNLRRENPTTQTEVHSRLGTARNMIAFLNSSSFLTWPERYNDQVFVISELQHIAYHDTDHGGVQDIAQWCVRAFLQLLTQNHEEAPEVLAGTSSCLRAIFIYATFLFLHASMTQQILT